MPRQPRLDAPGLLQHVMARGIERKEIFKDDEDRSDFLDRLGIILEETRTQCFAWALIPNHFHLLLRTGATTPLSKVMRRLMTGYAVSFNKRHRRTGHLFQNRYKSVVCEEDPYMLELMRYIHLNPLRARLVKSLEELDVYPWTGHSTILGNAKNPFSVYLAGTERAHTILLAEKTVEDVLIQFGNKRSEARSRYRSFVKDGIKQGTRPELQGGGLVRSAGGEKQGLLGRPKGEREQADERILGSGCFVTHVLNQTGHVGQVQAQQSLQTLCTRVAASFGIDVKDLRSASKKRVVSRAKSVFSYIAVTKMGYTGREVGRYLNIRGYSAIRRAAHGKEIVDKHSQIVE